MNLTRVAGLFGGRSAALPAPAAVPRGRGLRSIGAAGGPDVLYGSWLGQMHPLDDLLRHQLEPVRRRCRDLALNDPYARGYLRAARRHVAGPAGVAFSLSEETAGLSPDVAAAVVEAWEAQSERGAFDATGRLSRADAEQLFVHTVERDGECFVRLVRGAPGPYRFAVQFIAAERIPADLCRELPDGRFIWLGIEYAELGRPLAYYVRVPKTHAGGLRFEGRRDTFMRVPAAEMVHGFEVEDPEQTRGLPALVAAAKSRKMHSGYEEAELVGARTAAAKMGFFKRSGSLFGPDGEPLTLREDVDRESLISEAVPGHFDLLPDGVEVETFDPQYNGSGLAAFARSCLQALGVSVGVSYPTAAGDLTGVSFSSLRHGALDERDTWRTKQLALIRAFCAPVFRAWLDWTLDRGDLRPARPADYAAIARGARWRPRGWQWVDPAKEAKGDETQVRLRTKSRTEVAAAQGRDFREVLREIAAEEAFAAGLGVDLAAADAALGIPAAAEDAAAAVMEDAAEDAAG